MKKKLSHYLVCLWLSFSLLLMAGVAQSAPVVDILVLYVDAAEQTRSGRDIDARISSYIEYSNKAFENSNVDMRLRLVGSEKIDVDYTTVTGANLGALRSNREVAQLRQQYGADLVTLINLRQPMSGGYVCGVAYVPSGNSSTGQLASNAASVAFSLVGVDCGLNTFVHELGHNMGLGHSHTQGSQGGVWPWGRGHGIQSSFSTIMAYPQSFGTRNQLQRFSNPEQIACEGQACGVDRNQTRGADATRNLNSVAQQVADFMPRVVDIDEPEPQLPPCQKQDVEGNLIENGGFSSLDGWRALFGVSRLTQAEVRTDCVNNILAVTERTQYHSDAFQDLTDVLEVGKDYSFSGKFGVAGTDRDNVRFALQIKQGSNTRYQYLDPLSATANELTAYSADVSLDADEQPDRVGLVIYGPQPGVDILADEIVLLDVTVPEVPDPIDPIVLHDRFEREALGWSSYGRSQTVFSKRAFEGDYSIRNRYRSFNYSGPMREMTGLLEPWKTYSISTSVYVQDRWARSSTATLWLYYVDDQGSHWERIVNTGVAANRWQTIGGDFVISAVGDITQMRLLVAGPRSSAELYVDDLLIMQ